MGAVPSIDICTYQLIMQEEEISIFVIGLFNEKRETFT